MNTSLNVKVEDSTLMVLGHDASLFLLETTVDRLLVHPSGGLNITRDFSFPLVYRSSGCTVL